MRKTDLDEGEEEIEEFVAGLHEESGNFLPVAVTRLGGRVGVGVLHLSSSCARGIGEAAGGPSVPAGEAGKQFGMGRA